MRYYTDIKPTKYTFLNDMLDNPTLAFANDYVHFILGHFGHRYVPLKFREDIDIVELPRPGPKVHTVHPLSLFTKNMRLATLYIVEHYYKTFEDVFHEDPPPETRELDCFVTLLFQLSKRLINKTDIPTEDVLYGLAAIGKITILMHERGIKDATYLAPFLIGSIMWKFTHTFQFIFEILDLHAKNIVDGFMKK